MRVVSYNILDGGEGRADPLTEVILAQRPDVVALVEASFAPTVERMAARLKMDYVVAAGNQSGASAILTRWTIRQSINHAAIHRERLEKSFLEATLVDEKGAEIVVGALHLHAHGRESDEGLREAELDAVREAFAPHRSADRPHLLMGDFNANAPGQIIDPARVKPRTRSDLEANGGTLPRRVVARLLSEGYADLLADLHPAESAKTGTFSTQHPGQRVDYIFGWGIARSNVRAAWIEQDRLATYASDHYPVGAELDWP